MLAGGVPFLALLLWMNQAPDRVEVNLAARTMATVPKVDIKIRGAGGASKPVTKPVTTPDKPVDDVKPGDTKPEVPDKPVVQPFDY
ncbi:MAG: hypothetical protein JXR83_05040, partial [Deltaproteobacteria bacterium]|nr:hypothetical protein [Deltaproteobacteria bacterium]